MTGGGASSRAVSAAWYAAIIGVAIIALGVELDRQGRHDPAVAAMVPGPFRGDALESLARSAFDQSENVNGMMLARQLVERRPIPAEGLSLYANGLLANGRPDLAAPVLQIAAGRGWRDRFVQHVVIASALQSGQPEIAAQRVIGLWRQGERANWLKDLTKATLVQRGGITAFESSLADHEYYFGAAFLTWAAANLPVTSVNRLARDMAKHHTQFDCTRFSDDADSLARNGKLAAATAVWNAFCPNAHRVDINNVNFEQSEEEPGPFDWRYPESAGVDIQLSQEHGGTALHYSNSEPVQHVIARRYLALAPAHYVFAVDKPTDSSVARWRIACIEAGTASRELALHDFRDGHMSFVVPAGCSVQELSLAALLGSGVISRMEIQMAKE